MVERLNDARILIYSHDSFGLGHLRRCRAIAHALVDRFKGVSVLILSGSPIIGSFDFLPRVDFVRIPGVIKLHNGEYKSLSLHIDLDQTMAMRAAIIRHTALSFRPDLFLVDKEPLGLRGEVVATLEMLKAKGTHAGARPARRHGRAEAAAARMAAQERAARRSSDFYDDIWVYGLESFAIRSRASRCRRRVRRKMIYTGYLRRAVPQLGAAARSRRSAKSRSCW